MAIYYELRTDQLESGTGALLFVPVAPQIPSTTRVRLDVPWVGQNVGQDDDWSNSDCGPCCCAMILRYYNKDVTVNQASAVTGLPKGYTGTAYWDLTKILRNWNILSGRKAGITPDMLRKEIDGSHPAILLVHYGSLPIRSDQKFTGGHWIVLTGYDKDKGVFIYHDPYFKDSRGRHLEILEADLEKVMADCIIDKNTPNQGVFLTAAG